MKPSQSREIQSQVAAAINAAEDKKAENVAILQMDKSSSAFTDYFLIASGTNPKQVQAIADEIELRLKREGTYPNNVEGYKQAEWILLDYVHFVVHVFSENARKFYDLERLWKSAKRISATDLKKPARISASSGDGASARARARVAKRPKPMKSAAMKKTAKAIRAATSRTKSVAAKSKVKSGAKKKTSRGAKTRRSR